MSPWKKYRRLGVFPSKPLFHTLLIIATSWQIWSRNSIWADYTRGSLANFCHFFFPPSCVADDRCSILRVGDSCHLSDVNSTLGALSNAVKSYYSINETSLAAYNQQPSTDPKVAGISHPTLEIKSNDGTVKR